MSLIHKYNIREKDLYTLSAIELLKSNEGAFSIRKETLKAKTMSILKPYKVKFMDLGALIKEISESNFASNEELKAKYGEVHIEEIKSSYGKTIRILVVSVLAVSLILLLPIRNNKISLINQDFCGQYKGVVPVSDNPSYQLEGKYEISVWEFKLVGEKYRAHMEGRVWAGSEVTPFKGEMTIHESQFENYSSDSKPIIQVCVTDEYGGSIFGGDPCGLTQTFKEQGYNNGSLVTPSGYLVPRVVNYENWKHVPIE